MTPKHIILFPTILFLFLFTSCQEDNALEVDKVGNDFLVLAPDETIHEYTNKTLTSSLKELTQLEESRGFTSFGRRADELYQEALNFHFDSPERLKSFVQKNNRYLQIIEDDNGELTFETRLYKSGTRYLANLDGIYKFDGMATKLFEEGSAQIVSEQIQYLYQMDENDFSAKKFKDEGMKFNTSRSELLQTEDVANNCGIKRSGSKTSGNKRVRILIEMYYTYTVAGNNEPYLNLKAWAQNRTLGIWFNTNYTINSLFNVSVDSKVSTNPWQRTHYALPRATTSGKRELTLSLISNASVHFGGYYAWADIAATSAALIECNKSIPCSHPGSDCARAPGSGSGTGGNPDPCDGVLCLNGSVCSNGTCVFE